MSHITTHAVHEKVCQHKLMGRPPSRIILALLVSCDTASISETAYYLFLCLYHFVVTAHYWLYSVDTAVLDEYSTRQRLILVQPEPVLM